MEFTLQAAVTLGYLPVSDDFILVPAFQLLFRFLFQLLLVDRLRIVFTLQLLFDFSVNLCDELF
jgi:hypothetical protein